MAIVYSRNDFRRQITIVMTDTVTMSDVLGSVERQAAESTWSYTLLYDERASQPDMSIADLRRLLARVRELSGVYGKRGRVAMLMHPARDESVREVFEELRVTQPHQVEAFQDLQTAQDWLDVTALEERR